MSSVESTGKPVKTSGREYARSLVSHVVKAWQDSRVFVWVVLVILLPLMLIHAWVWAAFMSFVWWASVKELFARRPNPATMGRQNLLILSGYAIMTGGCLAAGWLRLTHPELLVVVLTAVFANDTFAIVGGKYLRLGRRFIKRPFSQASPNKTWEGSLFGVSFGTLAAVGVGVLVGLPLTLALVIIVLAICVAGIVGDIGESVWKRSFGLKDSGNILGAMGGACDRLDSLSIGLLAGLLLLLV